jgi:hypothetical protein
VYNSMLSLANTGGPCLVAQDGSLSRSSAPTQLDTSCFPSYGLVPRQAIEDSQLLKICLHAVQALKLSIMDKGGKSLAHRIGSELVSH